MNDPGPLTGPETPARRMVWNFGASVGESADGVPTLELTTDARIDGPHGRVNVKRGEMVLGNAKPRTLDANIRMPDGGFARCTSDNSIRMWGHFTPDVQVIVRSLGEVRILLRGSDGVLVAGPLPLAAENQETTLEW